MADTPPTVSGEATDEERLARIRQDSDWEGIHLRTRTQQDKDEAWLLKLVERQREALANARDALLAFDPPMPPMIEGETPGQYTDRLTGADRTGRVPYPERRNRQCSIGYHDECTDPEGHHCKCPCHRAYALGEAALVAIRGLEEANRA